MAVDVVLAAHPDNPPGLRCDVHVTLARRPDGNVAIGYAVAGDVERLRVPSPEEPAPPDALWRTSCCELFVMTDGGGAYREFNFSPSGQWAAYDFSGYRERATTPAAIPAPSIVARHDDHVLHVDVELPAAALPGGSMRLGVSAVLETRDGGIGYWALAHAPGRPDFHHPAAFTLILDKDDQ